MPLVRRAYERWRMLERRAGETLLVITGGVDAGPPDAENVLGALEACRLHDLEHELLDADALMARFPGFRVPGDYLAVYQPDAGFVLSERAIAAHAAAGPRRRRGPSRATRPSSTGSPRATASWCERIATPTGRDAWSSAPAPGRPACCPRWPAWPSRSGRSCMWSRTLRPERFAVGAFPVFILDVPEGRFYGFPEYGIPGFKQGLYHHRGETSTRTPGTASGARRAGGRGSPAGLHEPLLPGRRRADPDAEDLPLHEHARRALHHRPTARGAAGRRRLALQRPRLQVRPRRGRDRGRPGARGRDEPRHRHVPHRSLRRRAAMTRTIVCFGDSNTHGAHPDPAVGGRYPRDVRWPGVMRAALGEGYEVIEEGLNGRCTVWDTPHLAGPQRPRRTWRPASSPTSRWTSSSSCSARTTLKRIYGADGARDRRRRGRARRRGAGHALRSGRHATARAGGGARASR